MRAAVADADKRDVQLPVVRNLRPRAAAEGGNGCSGGQ
jgi:hypothetical protein